MTRKVCELYKKRASGISNRLFFFFSSSSMRHVNYYRNWEIPAEEGIWSRVGAVWHCIISLIEDLHVESKYTSKEERSSFLGIKSLCNCVALHRTPAIQQFHCPPICLFLISECGTFGVRYWLRMPGKSVERKTASLSPPSNRTDVFPHLFRHVLTRDT